MTSEKNLYIVSMRENLPRIKEFCVQHHITYQYKDNYMLLMTTLSQKELENSNLFDIKMLVAKDLFLEPEYSVGTDLSL